MYSLMLRTNFIAQHFLVGKDFGAENHKHSHHYCFELEIESKQLDQYNYLVDIVEVRDIMNKIVAQFNDKSLNDLSEFSNQNPSLEIFAKILWSKFKTHAQLPHDCCVSVRLWEDEIARASFRG